MLLLAQAAPEVRRAVLPGHTEMRQEVADSCRRSFAQLGLLRKMYARLDVQAGSGAPDDMVGVRQGIRTSAEGCSGLALAGEDETMLKKAVVEVDQPRPCLVHSPVQGTEDAQSQQYVLGVGRENEALT